MKNLLAKALWRKQPRRPSVLVINQVLGLIFYLGLYWAWELPLIIALAIFAFVILIPTFASTVELYLATLGCFAGTFLLMWALGLTLVVALAFGCAFAVLTLAFAPTIELYLAALGCFAGTFLLLGAVQFDNDIRASLQERQSPTNYFSINKRITGSGIENVGKSYDFNESEIESIEKRPEILELGTFSRSRFAVTLHLWPTGKLFGLGKAAKADVFFESVPDPFIDVETDAWKWKPEDPFVPLIIPKFYLDLWNLGFAPTREEYPTLGSEDALRMPVDILLGNPPDEKMVGKFVGFSRRINGILVPEDFLSWANEKYSAEDDANATSPSRLIVRTEAAPAKDLIAFLENQDYELNREMPKGDKWDDAITKAFLIVAGIGLAFSLLSVATFTVSFRLVVTSASERITNLLHLGFAHQALRQIYLSRFLRLFGLSFGASLLALWLVKHPTDEKLAQLSIEVPVGLAGPTFAVAGLYAAIFAATNLIIIHNTIRKLE